MGYSAYTAPYDEKVQENLNNLVNREPMTFDANNNNLYQQYKDAYQQLGQRAADETTAQGRQLRGGYGDTYIPRAAELTYDEYLKGLNDNIGNIYSLSAKDYENETNNLMNLFNNSNTMAQNDFARYLGEQNLALDKEKLELQKQQAAASRRGGGGGGGSKKKTKKLSAVLKTPGGSDYTVYGDTEAELAENAQEMNDYMYSQQNLIWYRNS